MNLSPIPYGRQHITEEDIEAVVAVLRADYLTQGPQLHAFESEFADYVGAKAGVGVSSGTAALHCCTMALNVRPGQKVMVTPMTFAASANCVLYCGGEVEFADIDPKTYLLDVEKVREKLEAAPKGAYAGIVAVDYAGYPVNTEAFRALADEFGCWLLEDGCHAPGAYFFDSQGEKQFAGSGAFADLAIFSFHPVKHIAAGEGGMVTTRNGGLAEQARLFRTHGMTRDEKRLERTDVGGWYYEMQALGYNYRLSELHAALGRTQLKRADAGLERRREIAQTYEDAFAKIPQIQTPYVAENIGHAWHLYVIQCNRRKELYNYLKSHQIHVQVHYVPTHYFPYYRKLGWKIGDFPVTEAFYDRCLTLPIYPSLRPEQQSFVIEKIEEFFQP